MLLTLEKTDIRNGQVTLPHNLVQRCPGKKNDRLQTEGCFGSEGPALLSAGELRNIPALHIRSWDHWACGRVQLPAPYPGEEAVLGLLLLVMRLMMQG